MGAAHRSWLRFVLALAAAFAIVPLWAAVPSALAAGDANTASCPGSTESSPGFRTYLPDCRAYELVTPPYKAGDFVAGEGASISPTGTALLGESLANFADEAPKVVGDPLNPYLFQRTPTGWTTSALLSPAEAALLVRPGKTIYRILFRGRDDESGRTLWSVLYRAGDELNLESIFYIEQPDGSFEELGPATPGPAAPNSFPTTSVGISNYAVSPGLTHVVFGGIDSELTLGEKWPGDTTAVGRENLFEYTSADKEEPRLVAVRNQHSLASNTEAELISSCGSFLGASFGDKRGALSDGGQEVIFTVAGGEGFECAGPPVDEIYVREGGERTLAISEPSHEDCEECNVTSGLESPVFQAASADGSKIYFTTSQELLPGATGSNLYVYDLAASPGHKVTQVSSGAGEAGVQGIVRISEDGSHA